MKVCANLLDDLRRVGVQVAFRVNDFVPVNRDAKLAEAAFDLFDFDSRLLFHFGRHTGSHYSFAGSNEAIADRHFSHRFILS